MVICSNCSSENENEAKFCKNCGSSLIVQSSIIEIRKEGDKKVSVIKSREDRMKQAKELALKALTEERVASLQEEKVAVHLGEKIV